MKRIGKHGTYAILSLTAVSLIGIGFSSWIINASTENPINNNVTVTAGSVDEKKFDFKVTNVSDGTVKFDSLLNGDSDVITGSGDKDEEDLDFSFTCSINKSSISTDLAGIYVKFSDTEAEGKTSKINELVSSNIIQTPISFGADSSDETNGKYGYLLIAGTAFNTPSIAVEATYDQPTEPDKIKKYTCTITENSDTYSIEIIFNFAWGSDFGYENPTNVSINEAHYESTIAGLKTLDAVDYLGLTVALTAVAK